MSACAAIGDRPSADPSRFAGGEPRSPSINACASSYATFASNRTTAAALADPRWLWFRLPEAELERALTRDAVRRGLQALPDDQREILLLREIQGLSYEEIAAALSLEGGTVKSRIFRARKKLCAYLLADGNISEVVSSTQTKEV